MVVLSSSGMGTLLLQIVNGSFVDIQTNSFADALEAKSIKAYIHSEAGQEGAKTAGTAVVNCKVW